MKKLLFTMIVFTFFISGVKAFQIDIDKIEINSKANELTNILSKSYKIDTEGFSKEVVIDKEAISLSRRLIDASFSDKSLESKKRDFASYIYLSDSNGFETLTGNIALNMYLEKIEEYEIKLEYVKDIKTASFHDDVLAFIYLDDCMTKEGRKDVVVAFWFKKDNNKYALYYPWVTLDDDLESYYNKVIDREENGEIIGDSYNKMSLNNQNNKVNNTLLNKLYKDNVSSVVQISGMNKNGLSVYGSGFFISEGIVVTTWSLFRQFLTNGNYIYVNDSAGNTYNVLGVVAAQSDYDVVVLKLNKNVGVNVVFGDTDKLNETENLFMINSKINGGFSIKYGTYLSQKDGRLKNMFLINDSDVGAALFNKSGEVVAFNTQDLLNSDLSYANSTIYLKKLQELLNKQSYGKIGYVDIEVFKDSYYLNIEEEKNYNNIDNKIWDKYKEIGHIEETITLPLVKATYKDKILSLRYKNSVNNMIDSLYLISGYVDELSKDGYKLTYEDKNKKIYKNDQYKIIIKDNLNYLIVLIMEI